MFVGFYQSRESLRYSVPVDLLVDDLLFASSLVDGKKVEPSNYFETENALLGKVKLLRHLCNVDDHSSQPVPQEVVNIRVSDRLGLNWPYEWEG